MFVFLVVSLYLYNNPYYLIYANAGKITSEITQRSGEILPMLDKFDSQVERESYLISIYRRDLKGKIPEPISITGNSDVIYFESLVSKISF